MKLKNISKIMILVLFIMFLLFLGSKSLAANGTAFSMGALFDGIDTRPETLHASRCYTSMGYNSSYSTSPTYDLLIGSANGSKRLESDILFISGHGREDGKRIRVLNTGVITGSTSNGFVGVNNINWNTTKLVVYAACLTAKTGENNHISLETYRKGADTVLGWHQEIGATSHTKWLNRFNSHLASGNSFSSSFQYASSFNDYSDNRVKDLGVYGDWNTTYSTKKTDVMENTNTITVTEDIEFTKENQNIEGIKELVKSINPNFNEDDYKLDIFNLNEKDNFFTIDFIHRINGFTTDLGYNIAVSNGKVTSITDNDADIPIAMDDMQKLSGEEETISLKNARNEAIKNAKNNDISKLSTSGDENINITEQSSDYYYDINTNKKYYRILTTTVDEEGYVNVSEYYREI